VLGGVGGGTGMYIFSRSGLAFIALAGISANGCFAQSSPATTAAEEPSLDEVVVTGSRLATGFATPTPVTVVAAEELSAAVPNNIGEALSQLPSLAGSVQNSTSGQGSGNSQVNGQNLLNLRRLGSERTLVLLDGQRMGVTNVVGSVDINIIPQNLVRRVDVVTGGASASYGSDAVAGVVNFILDTTFEGLKFEANAGITDKSDTENGKMSVAFGKQLNDRFRFVGAAEYFKMKGIKYGEITGRDWFDRPRTTVANSAANVAAGQPRWLLLDNVRSRYGSYGGTITQVVGTAANATANCADAACAALVTKQFQPDGSLIPFNVGSSAFGNNLYVSGGDGVAVNQPPTPNADRYSAFLHGELELNDNVTFWAQGGYNLSKTFIEAQVLQVQSATGQGNSWRIFEDNAYLPTAIKNSLAAVPGLQSFYLTRYNRDMTFNTVEGDVEVMRFATGAKGRLGERLSWDAIVGYQDSHQDLNIQTAVFRNLYAAADAVVHPTTGQVVCRSQWYDTNGVFVPGGTGLDAGCAPLNLFGEGNVSQAANDFVIGLNTAAVDIKQTTADLNLRGDFGERIGLGAGPISFATGLNFRRLTASREVDPLSATYKDGTGLRGFPNQQGVYGGYTYYNPSPIDGTVNVKELYAELGVPLLKDLPLIQEFDTTLAGRVTDYSQSGVERMWKLGLNWKMADSLRMRGTISADTRAPNVIELFNTAQVSRGSATLPATGVPGGFVSQNQQTVSIGNPNLAPERARTYTAGFVFSPGFLPGLQASIDWYKIQMTGAISEPGAIIDKCYAGDQEFCSLIKVNGQSITTTAGITATDFIVLTNQLVNEPADRQTSGIDVETAYRKALGTGELNLRFTGSYLLKDYDGDSGCAAGSLGQTFDFVGAIGNCGINPKIRARVSAKYDIGRFGIYMQERYIDKGVRNPNFVTGVDITTNDIPAFWYTDATLSFNLGEWRGSEGGELYLNVTNIFDKEPPPTNSTGGRSWVEPTETELYDTLGRRYVLGARLRW
jgi:iron complex outermembrane receptor protein